MGLQWDTNYIRSLPGMCMCAEVLFAFVGGIVLFIPLTGGLGGALLTFCFWSTVVISGIILLCHICNLMQVVEAKIPFFIKIHLGYIGIWSILYLIASVLSFITFGVASIFGYLVLAAMLVEGFMKYRAYRSGVTATANTPASNVEAGGYL